MFVDMSTRSQFVRRGSLWKWASTSRTGTMLDTENGKFGFSDFYHTKKYFFWKIYGHFLRENFEEKQRKKILFS